jgi:hypothetical protein
MRCFYRFLFLSPVTFCACGGETSTLLLAPPGSEGGVGATEGGVGATEGGVVATDGGGGSTLACGPFTCKLPGEQCCVSATPTYSCMGKCPPNDTALKCASAANCGGGEVCCVSQNPLQSACMKACGNGDAMLCDPAATPAANRCANSAPCSTKNIGDWGLPSTYGTCGGVGN